MFGHSFYFSTIRKYTSLMGTLFSDVVIERFAAPAFSANTQDQEYFGGQTGTQPTQVIKVPLTYGPKDKLIQRYMMDPTLSRPEAVVTLPMMTYEMVGITYDRTRKLDTIGRIVVPDPTTNSKLRYQYNPVPYNVKYRLSILVKNYEDGAKIVEHLLPFFTPEWTQTVIMIPEMGVREDVSVVLHDVQTIDKYDGPYDQRRPIVWELDFTLRGKFYGPVQSRPIIQFIDMPIYAVTTVANTLGSNNTSTLLDYDVTIQTTPGLSANGLPVYQANQTINVSMISVSNDYGFVTQVTDYDP